MRFNLDDFVKSPDTALRFVLRHGGVRSVRLTPQDLRALPADFLKRRPKMTFYEFISLVDS